jgi:DNA-binding PadR family transcriptional regulator
MLKHFFDHMRDPEHHSRLFARGEIKYVVLGILKNGPSHGYEIIHFMEDSFHGSYSPSAGSVYPTLQMLEDMGYVSSSVRDGKKVYTITDAGERFLEESKEVVSRINGHMHHWQRESNRDEERDAYRELYRMARLMYRRTRSLNRKRLAEIRNILAEAGRHIENVLDEEG